MSPGNGIHGFYSQFPDQKSVSPVVKRSWTSAAELDSDREGMVVGGCGGGGREVEAGEDWVRTRGW